MHKLIVLAQRDAPPPPGRSRWNGRLLADAWGDVSADQVWAVLGKHDIQIQVPERAPGWLRLPTERP